jgi:hypothetical protein
MSELAHMHKGCSKDDGVWRDGRFYPCLEATSKGKRVIPITVKKIM